MITVDIQNLFWDNFELLYKMLTHFNVIFDDSFLIKLGFLVIVGK